MVFEGVEECQQVNKDMLIILTLISLLSLCNAFWLNIPTSRGHNGGFGGSMGGTNGGGRPPNPPRSLFNNFGDNGDDNGGENGGDMDNGMRLGSVYGSIGVVGPQGFRSLGRVCQRTLKAIEDAFKNAGSGGERRKDRKAIKDLENTIVLDVRANSTILSRDIVREGERKCERVKWRAERVQSRAERLQ